MSPSRNKRTVGGCLCGGGSPAQNQAGTGPGTPGTGPRDAGTGPGDPGIGPGDFGTGPGDLGTGAGVHETGPGVPQVLVFSLSLSLSRTCSFSLKFLFTRSQEHASFHGVCVCGKSKSNDAAKYMCNTNA